MNRVVALVAILLLSAPLSMHGAPPTDLKDFRLKRIDDPLRVEFLTPTTDVRKENIRKAVATAAEQLRWKIDKESDERMELTTEVRGKHTARIELKYNPAGYVIRYLDSGNLLYDANAVTVKGASARVIHKTYNALVRDLASRTNSLLSVTARVSVSSEPLRASQ